MVTMISILIGIAIGVAAIVLVRRVVASLSVNNLNVVDPATVVEAPKAAKRKGGRPKGSKNKKKRVVRRRTPIVDVFDEDEETV